MEFDLTEHRGLLIFVSAVGIFVLLIAIVQPEPIPTVTRQIQIAVGVYDWGFVIVNEYGEEIGSNLDWKGLFDNETNTLKVGVKNTGTVDIRLEISFAGDAEAVLEDYGNATREMWHIPNVAESKIAFVHDYDGEMVHEQQTCWITLETISGSITKTERTFTIYLQVNAFTLEET